MEIRCRVNEIYHELQKSIQNSLISHNIILELSSANATKCAYNGIEYTVQNVIENIKNYNIKIDDYTKCDDSKIFCITRSNNIHSSNINLTITLKEKQIVFQFHIYI